MVTILMGLISIIFPISAGFMIFALQTIDAGNKIGSIPYAILAFIFWGIGVWTWRELGKAYENEKIEELNKFAAQLSELRGIREDVTGSIKELIEEIRRDRNERNKFKSD